MLTPKCFITSQKKEAEALKEIDTQKTSCVRVQDKGSRFVVISNDEYCKKVNTQIERSSFTQVPHNITKSLRTKQTILLGNGKISIKK